MPAFRLSKRARDKLLDIHERSREMFGQYQANAYQTGFEKTFELLAMFPAVAGR